MDEKTRAEKRRQVVANAIGYGWYKDDPNVRKDEVLGAVWISFEELKRIEEIADRVITQLNNFDNPEEKK